MLPRPKVLSVLLSLASVASRSDALGFSDRASSVCHSSSLNSTVGLAFDVFCDSSFPVDGFQSSSTLPDLNTCIDTCTISRPLCFAAIFDSSSGNCTLYDLTAAERSRSSSPGKDTAIVNPVSQLTTSLKTECPYVNGSSQVINGAEFTIVCGVDEPYNDYCASDVIPCVTHQTTLADCLNVCTEAHPLCAGASWNPDMTQGYGNCYLKTGFPDRGLQVAQGDNKSGDMFVVHTGLASIANGSSLPYSCTDQGQISASNGQVFVTSCNANQVDHNLTISHENTIDGCINKCATWPSGACIGIMYDATVTGGWDNCYLKNGTSELFHGTNVTVATLIRGSASTTTSTQTPTQTPTPPPANSTAPSSGGSSSSPNAGTIAGSVVGGVAGLALILTAAWWFLFRKRRHQGPSLTGAEDKFEGSQSAVPLTAKYHAAELHGSTEYATELPEHHRREERAEMAG